MAETTAEANSNGVANKPGLYVHDESGAKIVTTTAIQGDALVRLGYTWRGEAPKKGKTADAEETEKPLAKQNRKELEQTADREGVEVTSEHDTNKKLAAAIQDARDAK